MLFTCLRHSKAAPAKVDRDRVLSAEGVDLARRRRVELGNPVFTHVVHSGYLRAEQTAGILAWKSQAKVFAVPELWFAGPDIDGPLTEAYGKLGETGTTRQYMEIVGHILRPCARAAAMEVKLATGGGMPSDNILIVGHGIFLPAVCLELFLGAEELILDSAIAPCEGFRVEIGERAKVEIIR